MTRETGNPYFWARFAQPSALVYARDDKTERRHRAYLRSIANRLCQCQGPDAETDALTIWTAGFNATYQSEFRSERTNRAAASFPQRPITTGSGKASGFGNTHHANQPCAA